MVLGPPGLLGAYEDSITVTEGNGIRVPFQGSLALDRHLTFSQPGNIVQPLLSPSLHVTFQK